MTPEERANQFCGFDAHEDVWLLTDDGAQVSLSQALLSAERRGWLMCREEAATYAAESGACYISEQIRKLEPPE